MFRKLKFLVKAILIALILTWLLQRYQSIAAAIESGITLNANELTFAFLNGAFTFKPVEFLLQFVTIFIFVFLTARPEYAPQTRKLFRRIKHLEERVAVLEHEKAVNYQEPVEHVPVSQDIPQQS